MYYYLDDLTIDTVRKKVCRSQQSLNINGLSFEFLAFMLTRDTRVVTFQELMDGVWSPSVVNEDTVTQRVLLLRNALGDNGRNPRYIRSVRAQGYQLVAQPVAENTPPKTTRLAAIQPRSIVWLMACITLVGVLSVLGLKGLGQNGLGGLGQLGEVADKGSASKFLQRANYYASIGQHDDNARAIELYQRVLLSEPQNTQAMIGLSRAFTASMCRFNADWARAEQAESLARRVIAIEPDSPDAFRVLGYSQDCRGQIVAAKGSYLAAIELDPNNDVRSQSALAYSLGETGHLAEALALNLSVSRADPRQTFTSIQLGRVYELLGLNSRAEPLFAESFELYPDNIFSNLSYPRHLFHQGRFSEARQAMKRAKARPIHPDLLVLSAELAMLDNDIEQAKRDLLKAATMRPSSQYLSLLVKLYPTVQQPIDWLPEKLTALREKPKPSDPADWLQHALLYQALGEDQAGINALLSAVESGYRNKDYLQLSPLFEQLRASPTFGEVMARIKLAVKQELEAAHAAGLITQFAGR